MEKVLYTLHFNYIDGLFLLIPVVFSIAIFYRNSKKRTGETSQSFREKVGRLLFKLMAVVLSLLCALPIGVTVFSYYYCVKIFKSGNVSEITGYVENYIPMPATGHSMESFEIDGVQFEYSNYGVELGYHSAASLGGVVTHDGQHLRIQYIDLNTGKVIVYIAEIT